MMNDIIISENDTCTKIFKNIITIKIYNSCKIQICTNEKHLHLGIYNRGKKIKIPHTNAMCILYGNYYVKKIQIKSLFSIEDNCTLYETQLTMKQHLNKKIIISRNITKLIFCYFFNTKIKIPYHITYLIIEYNFNKKITIPQNITHLILNCKNNIKITIPHNITHLKIYRGIFCERKIIISHNVIHLQILRSEYYLLKINTLLLNQPKIYINSSFLIKNHNHNHNHNHKKF